MDAVTLLALLAAAGAVFVAALALQNTLTSTRRVVQQRTLASGLTGRGHSTSVLLSVPRLENLSRRGRRLAFELERAGVNLTVTEYIFLRAGAGLATGVLGLVLASSIGIGSFWLFIVAVAGFLIGYWLPTRYLEMRKARRLRRAEDQLLEALTSMAKSLRAGIGLTQALEYAGRELPEPLGPELQRIVRELQLGADIEVALEEMNQRIGSGDLEIASTAIIIQRRVGGNLSEILTNVANTIRERKQIRSELNAVTARARLQGNLSALIPVAVAAFFFTVNPDTARLMFTTTVGNIALAVGIFFELMGLWLVRRFAQIEV